jgi:hypothetical protein
MGNPTVSVSQAYESEGHVWAWPSSGGWVGLRAFKVIRAIAYIDSIGGWISREFTAEEVAALSRFARPRPERGREFSAPRDYKHVKPGQPKARWWLSRFTSEAVELLQRWEAEGRFQITINRFDPAVDRECRTFKESEAKAAWFGERITKPRTQGDTWATFEDASWYAGFIIKDPYHRTAKADEQDRNEANNEEAERQRGWGTVVYGDKFSRWGSGPCVHVETRFRDQQFVSKLGIESLADALAMMDDPARIAAIVAEHVRLVKVDWAKLAAQHARVHPPTNPSSSFHRERESIMRRASRSMAQAALTKWGRKPGMDRRVWAKSIDHPTWFVEAVAAVAGDNATTEHATTTNPNEHEEVIHHETQHPRATSKGRRCGGDEAARSESGVQRGQWERHPAPGVHVPSILRDSCSEVVRSRVVPHERSQDATSVRMRLPRWCFGERPRLFDAPPERRGCPVGPSGPPGGTVGTPTPPERPTQAPRPPVAGAELSMRPPSPRPRVRLNAAA